MKKISLYAVILSLSGSLVILGGGCNLANLTNPATVVNNVNQSTALTETQYYNTVIQSLNTTADQSVQIQDTYRTFSEATTVEDRAGAFTLVDTVMYAAAKKTVLDDAVVMQNTDAQTAIEAQLMPYFDQYNMLLEANNAVAEYYQRGQYKDDAEAKKDALLTRFTEALNTTITMQTNLFDLVEQYQNQVDLGIDVNTTDPLEVVTLTQDTLTKDAAKLFKSYQTWIKAYSQGDETSDLTVPQTDFDKLSADLKTYQQRAKDVAIETKTAPALSGAFQEYMESINQYSITLENVLRDGKNNAITDVTTVDNEVVERYNTVIDKHNYLVEQVQGQ